MVISSHSGLMGAAASLAEMDGTQGRSVDRKPFGRDSGRGRSLSAARIAQTDGLFRPRSLAFTRPSELQAITLPDSNTCLMFDVHLPEMSGVELYEKLNAAGCRLPVIMITGHADDSMRLMISRINAVAILIKPFGRDMLLAAITKALALGAHLP
jgi:DNA-binding NarL/FixJ family response regulator